MSYMSNQHLKKNHFWNCFGQITHKHLQYMQTNSINGIKCGAQIINAQLFRTKMASSH